VSGPTDPSDHGDLYDPTAVRELFDEMSDTYERVNLVTSFGFSRRWRRQAVDHLRLQPGETAPRLMTGMGGPGHTSSGTWAGGAGSPP
jgi:demethylmenaquinone methyltransferase/2-methoxy-6-polyprenyl-1,4-benzoquinol methylase